MPAPGRQIAGLEPHFLPVAALPRRGGVEPRSRWSPPKRATQGHERAREEKVLGVRRSRANISMREQRERGRKLGVTEELTRMN